MSKELVAGIDLGTTNSSIGVVQQGVPQLFPVDGSVLLPSVVGLAPDGKLLVGRAARNQYLLYPERTVSSIKRRMGENVHLQLGEQTHTPVEISAMILRRLKLVAQAQLGQPVERAVITVPAYFSDAQRTATRAAGEVAGFVVERILHEPTAASLCYAGEAGQGAFARARHLLIFDLGGGTFDVSIVRQQEEITEVLSSHGDTHLGGDDFDAALLARLRRLFEEKHGVRLEGDRRALARLTRLAEETKIRLSTESFVHAREEHLTEKDGIPLHLDEEVLRHDYEGLILPFLERTKDSVQLALREAGLLARELDEVILVGGSTRTPLVCAMLHELLGRVPRQDVDPDRAVALGATLQAARLGGEDVGRILVDVTPFSFGTSYLGELYGLPSGDCYKAIIHRNTPLPVRQTEIFYTFNEGQEAVDVRIYQGENVDARRNQLLGRFMVEGLDGRVDAGSPILFDLQLDLDGILEVEVTEKHTGLKKRVVIEDAFHKLSPDELEEARRRVQGSLDASVAGDLGMEEVGAVPDDGAIGCGEVEEDGEDGEDGKEAEAGRPRPPADLAAAERAAWVAATSLLEKAERMLPRLLAADREEVQGLAFQLRQDLEGHDFPAIRLTSSELSDVLFYLE